MTGAGAGALGLSAGGCAISVEDDAASWRSDLLKLPRKSKMFLEASVQAAASIWGAVAKMMVAVGLQDLSSSMMITRAASSRAIESAIVASSRAMLRMFIVMIAALTRMLASIRLNRIVVVADFIIFVVMVLIVILRFAQPESSIQIHRVKFEQRDEQ